MCCTRIGVSSACATCGHVDSVDSVEGWTVKIRNVLSATISIQGYGHSQLRHSKAEGWTLVVKKPTSFEWHHLIQAAGTSGHCEALVRTIRLSYKITPPRTALAIFLGIQLIWILVCSRVDLYVTRLSVWYLTSLSIQFSGILLLPPPSVGPNVRFVTDDPIKPNRNPIKLDGISMEIQAPTSTGYVRERYSRLHKKVQVTLFKKVFVHVSVRQRE